MSVTEITAAQVKALRDRTGAAMMACKKALIESEGDVEAAIEALRARGESQAAKRAGNDASNGTVQSYIHGAGGTPVGVLVEVDCETEADIPAEVLESEKRIATEQAQDRPENVRERIVEGKVNKFLAENVLLSQVHVNPKYEDKKIEDIRAQLASEMGENVVVRRFTRFQVGS
jgi:elongation factor Ts